MPISLFFPKDKDTNTHKQFLAEDGKKDETKMQEHNEKHFYDSPQTPAEERKRTDFSYREN